MDKQEPVIIASNLSNEELLKWMQDKIGAAVQLKEALSMQKHYQKALQEVTDRIEMLQKSAALQVEASIKPAVIFEFFESAYIEDSEITKAKISLEGSKTQSV